MMRCPRGLRANGEGCEVAPTSDANTVSGRHTPETFVQLVLVLFRDRQTGVLTTQSEGKSCRTHFLGGRPLSTHFETDSKPSPPPSTGLADQAVTPLSWPRGEWRFEAKPSLDAATIDPQLIPDLDLMAGLWAAVQRHIPADTVFAHITAAEGGLIAPDPICKVLLPSFGLDPAFVGLVDVMGSACSIEDIFRAIPDVTGDLVKLLWLLETTGLTHRQGRPHDTFLEEAVRSASTYVAPPSSAQGQQSLEPSVPTPSRRSSSPSVSRGVTSGDESPKRRRPPMTDEQIQATHRRRMGRDFYAFLGLSSDATSEEIDRKCKGLARRWRLPGKQRQLPPEQAAQIDELLAGVQLVWRTLTEAEHRAEYDQRHAQGRAPLVGDLRTAAVAPSPGAATPAEQAKEPEENPALREARGLMRRGQYREALTALKALRVDHPSDPDIMADLGWSTWNLQGAKNGDAEEFLRLALTFDDRHPGGHEYLAKILMAKGDEATARVLVQRLRRIRPENTWAKQALKKLTRGDA